jgi:D-alanyl-D-alanine carboxypeptidase
MRAHYSIDAHALWYACKLICLFLVMAAATKYGVVRASERVAQEAAAGAAQPAHMLVQNQTSRYRDVPLPQIGAEAYLVAELTGAVIAGRNADTPLPIASITKLVSGLVASEVPADALITITQGDRAHSEGTPGRLPAGTTYRAEDLMYPLLMESNNSVAFAFARAHTRFMACNPRASSSRRAFLRRIARALEISCS